MQQLNNCFGIYQIRQLSTNNIYIGSTCRNFYDRFCKHRSDLRANKHSSIYLQRAYNKYGADDFVFEILEILSIPDVCWQREKYLVKSLNPVFNVSKSIGPTRLGNLVSTETKNKISSSMIGLKKTKEHKKNMSKSKTGPKNPAYGKKESEEHKKERTKKNKKRVIRSDGTEYASINDAASQNNCTYQNISQALRKGMVAKGYRWSYAKG